MKRLRIVLATGLVLGVLVCVLARAPKTDPSAPSYVVARSQPVGGFGRENYSWSSAVPFHDSKVWIFTILSRTNHHEFLYDLDQRTILGELFNGGADFGNQDQTKFLCSGVPAPVSAFKQKAVAFINRFSLGKIHLATNMVDAFWILDVRDNSARRIGELAQLPGYGSSWVPAPGFRFGYNCPSASAQDQEFFLCDLEKGVLQKIKFAGKLHGWWDDHEILAKDSTNNLVLFDVLTRKTAILFTADSIVQFLKENNLPNLGPGVFSSWNGHEYDYYFFNGKFGEYRPGSGTSFLLKASHADPKLFLVSRDFQFGHLGVFNETGTLYAYNGESGATGRGGNGAVFLRDLKDNTMHTLVPPDNAGQYALPRFYRDKIIYYHNAVLWSIDLNGSNNVRLLPPSGR